MVENLVRDEMLGNLMLRAAFLSIDRRDFVPEALRSRAYLNEALPLGYGATISQPWTIAFMLNLLEPESGERVLDIGSGSGYQTALLAYLVNQEDAHHKGKVFGLEIVPELAKESLRNLAKYQFVHRGIVEIHCINAERGYPAGAFFDKIISAAALATPKSGTKAGSDIVPQAWKDQLKINGRIVAPVGNEIVKLTKTQNPDNTITFTEERFPGFAFVEFREE